MNRLLHGCVFSVVLALAATAGAQIQPAPTLPGQIGPKPRTQLPPRDKPEIPTTRSAAVTVEGCLVREADVPGRKPYAAERNSEHYILTNTRMISGTAPSAGAAESRASATMYEVDGIGEDQLKHYGGRRVQIDGDFDHVERGSTPPNEAAPHDLVQIEGIAIRQAAGDCAVK